MAIIYTDSEIAELLLEGKHLPANWRTRLLHLNRKRGHAEGHLEFNGDSGSEFKLIVRRSSINYLDFPVILAVRVPQSNLLFRLRRCNGFSHPHTNHIEGNRFYTYHIHMATERYQNSGYAKTATRKLPTDIATWLVRSTA